MHCFGLLQGNKMDKYIFKCVRKFKNFIFIAD